MDTAGQEDLQGLVEKSIQKVQAIILVFAIDCVESFEFAKMKQQYIKEKNIPFVLIGNKCDLENERKISKEQALKQAQEWKVKYIETSATEVKQITLKALIRQ